jgi:hypothetical protein
MDCNDIEEEEEEEEGKKENEAKNQWSDIKLWSRKMRVFKQEWTRNSKLLRRALRSALSHH